MSYIGYFEQKQEQESKNKRTDEEVIKTLEHCSASNIKGRRNCPYNGIEDCITRLEAAALDLINRQRAEIDDLTRDTIPKLKNGLERANKYGVELEKELANAKAEAVKEFAERLKPRIDCEYGNKFYREKCFEEIDNLVEEMAEGEE